MSPCCHGAFVLRRTAEFVVVHGTCLLPSSSAEKYELRILPRRKLKRLKQFDALHACCNRKTFQFQTI